jgi:hypothetical protein
LVTWCFLQGVLAQATNGEEHIWEDKFLETNGKAQACIQGASFFFLLNLGGGGGGGGGYFFFFIYYFLDKKIFFFFF